jgi:hypothetical protein
MRFNKMMFWGMEKCFFNLLALKGKPVVEFVK